MNDRDYHAMSHARAALMDGKNELIRCGSGSDETLRLMRAAEAALGRQMDAADETTVAEVAALMGLGEHQENMAAGAQEIPNL